MIHILYRTCGAIDNKPRPSWFNKQEAYTKFVKSLDNFSEEISFHVLFDGFEKAVPPYIGMMPTVCFRGGSGAASYLYAVTYAVTTKIGLEFQQNDYVYLVEDDYYHHPEWVRVLSEMVSSDTDDYFTLYDHPDKYDKKMYPSLQSEIVKHGDSLWRTTPSTTDTYCVKLSTLHGDYNTHIRYSSGVQYSRDHERFNYISSFGRKVWSSIPGYSVHCHEPWCNIRRDYFND